MKNTIFMSSFLLMLYSCTPAQKKISVLQVMSNASSNNNLKLGMLSNLDTLYGIKGMRLNTAFNNYDWSKADTSLVINDKKEEPDESLPWQIDSTADGSLIKCSHFINSTKINIGTSQATKLALYFSDKKLQGIKLDFDMGDDLENNLIKIFGAASYVYAPETSGILDFFKKRKAAMELPDYQAFECDKLPDMLFNERNILWKDYDYELKDIEDGGQNNIINSLFTHQSPFVRFATAKEKLGIIRKIKNRYEFQNMSSAKANDLTTWNTPKVILTYASQYGYLLTPYNSKEYPEGNIIYNVYANEKYPNEGFPHHFDFSYGILKDAKVYVEVFTTKMKSSENWDEIIRYRNAKGVQEQKDGQDKKLLDGL